MNSDPLGHADSLIGLRTGAVEICGIPPLPQKKDAARMGHPAMVLLDSMPFSRPVLARLLWRGPLPRSFPAAYLIARGAWGRGSGLRRSLRLRGAPAPGRVPARQW